MPTTQVTKEINAPAERLYQIMKEREKNPIWNITVNDVNIISEKKASYKTTVGDLTLMLTEDIKNEKIAYDVEGNPLMTKMIYSFKPKGDKSEATLAGEFPLEDQEKILLTAADVLLESLKKYAEYLQEGGDPSEYEK